MTLWRLLLIAVASSVGLAPNVAATPSVTGPALAGLERAVTRNGRLVLARGYGFRGSRGANAGAAGLAVSDREPQQVHHRRRHPAAGRYVQTQVLAKAGATHMAIGRSLPSDRAVGEVRYHPFAAAPLSAPVFPALTGGVAAPYGGFHLEAMDAHGAWIANAIDYVRLLAAVDGTRPPALVAGPALVTLTARPAPPVSVDTAAYYGLGLQVRPIRGAIGTGANWWHGGSLPGTITYAVRLANGWSWAAFFNSRPEESGPFSSEIDRAINAALAASPPPTEGDLFVQFASAKR